MRGTSRQVDIGIHGALVTLAAINAQQYPTEIAKFPPKEWKPKKKE